MGFLVYSLLGKSKRLRIISELAGCQPIIPLSKLLSSYPYNQGDLTGIFSVLLSSFPECVGHLLNRY